MGIKTKMNPMGGILGDNNLYAPSFYMTSEESIWCINNTLTGYIIPTNSNRFSGSYFTKPNIRAFVWGGFAMTGHQGSGVWRDSSRPEYLYVTANNELRCSRNSTWNIKLTDFQMFLSGGFNVYYNYNSSLYATYLANNKIYRVSWAWNDQNNAAITAGTISLIQDLSMVDSLIAPYIFNLFNTKGLSGWEGAYLNGLNLYAYGGTQYLRSLNRVLSTVSNKYNPNAFSHNNFKSGGNYNAYFTSGESCIIGAFISTQNTTVTLTNASDITNNVIRVLDTDMGIRGTRSVKIPNNTFFVIQAIKAALIFPTVTNVIPILATGT